MKNKGILKNHGGSQLFVATAVRWDTPRNFVPVKRDGDHNAISRILRGEPSIRAPSAGVRGISAQNAHLQNLKGAVIGTPEEWIKTEMRLTGQTLASREEVME